MNRTSIAILLSLFASASSFANVAVICGSNEAQVNAKISKIPNIQSVSQPGVGIAKASSSVATTEPGAVYQMPVETERLICVTVKN